MAKISEINTRQEKILEAIEQKNKKIAISEIINDIKKISPDIKRITVSRDLKKLVELSFIDKIGVGKKTLYKISDNYRLFQKINVDKYFETSYLKREINYKFNFKIFSQMKNIFSDKENEYLNNLNKTYRENLKKITPMIFKKEMERLVIELSWKSSRIEGNTYTLLETEDLIKTNIPSPLHSKEEALMILNHKETIQHINKNNKRYLNFSVSKIEDIHHLLTKNLNISRNIREIIVKISGTKYIPLDNKYQIKEALQKTCKIVNKEKNPFAKAVMLMVLISYIQPFEDGNKRTSRLLGNAALIANSICPLSFGSVEEVEYKKAILLFYEQNNLNYFKQIFIEQFEFAATNYFQV